MDTKGPSGLIAHRPARRLASGAAQVVQAAILALACAAIAGCANAALRKARAEIAAGHYPTAHQQLLAARDDPTLWSWRRSEIDDDLCLTETKIGAPAYPITEQLSACDRASSEGAEQSGKLLAGIQAAQRQSQIKAINQAIAAKDLA